MQEKPSLDETHIDELLQVLEPGNTLLVQVGRAPFVKRNCAEQIRELNYEICKPQHVQSLVYDIISDAQIQRFEQNLELAFVHTMCLAHPKRAHFVVLVARERGNMAASFLALSRAP